MASKKQKFNLYNFLNPERYDKKDALEDKDAEKMGFLWFFKLLGRRLSTIFSVNLLFVLGNFPFFFVFVAFAALERSVVPQALSFSNLYGALQGRDADPLSSVLFGVSGAPSFENEVGVLTIVFLILACLVLFTFGPVNCGCAHIIRSVLRREPVFLFQDFFGTIKKNLKQGLPLGVFDLLFLGVLTYDIWLFYQNYSASFLFTVLFFFSIAVMITYLFARPYLYMLCITFDLKFFKLIKNAVIFAFLGVKRNVLALLANAFLVFLTVAMMISGILMALAVLLPIVILCGLSLYIGYYASYKVIRKYMIDPYYDEDGNPLPEKKKEGDASETLS